MEGVFRPRWLMRVTPLWGVNRVMLTMINYQPPCPNNIVDASKAVWKALGVPEESDDWGKLNITWSDA